MTKYIGEDVPRYMVDKPGNAPRNDEDAAMSAPKTLYEGDSLQAARNAVGLHLLQGSFLEHVALAGMAQEYREASDRFYAGDDTPFKTIGRVYRVREVGE